MVGRNTHLFKERDTLDKNVVDLKTWKQCSDIEEDYLNFLSHINKYLRVPTDIPDLTRSFYFTIRYLEGTVNALDILSMVKPLPEKELEELKTHVIEQLDEIKASLMKF